ncbi:ras GTPase-activating protein-binding protein 1-like isoform X1 [Canna indica]|uniref:Ras GTPase-activating protein-binding protein 1-like isoform X1 n=1 Tax=Canna indica TaxID=4628 RepID=A0AAQ3Q4H0_9LILI|nr:ras GTPase-activating protein-binding protein 1-like isoform X1 [Canna indica]
MLRETSTQSFFLAPQDKGFYVLNDVFRFIEEADHQQGNQSFANGIDTPHVQEDDFPPQQEQHAPEDIVSVPVEEEGISNEEVYNTSENGEVVVEEEPIAEVIDEIPNNSQAAEAVEAVEAVVVEPNVITAHEEMPKKSYASIVKVMKDNASASVSARAPSRPMPIRAEPQTVAAPTAAPASDVPVTSSTTAESSNVQEAEAEGYSIYVKSLPLDATPTQLEDEFKKFGPIKPGGIQVRSHKLQGFCYGFVEFEVASAVHSAIEASPVMIGGRPAYVEEKRTTSSRVGNRGRFPPGRGGGFRGDGRGRGNYSGGRGYGRGDFNARPDFGGRGGGGWGRSSNRASDVGYQRVDNFDTSGSRGSTAGSSAIPASNKN